MQSDYTRKSGTVNPATSHFETVYSTLPSLPLPLPSLMRIILVTASPIGKARFYPNMLLANAFRQLAVEDPAHEWLVPPAFTIPKGWSLFGSRKSIKHLRDLSPNLAFYSSLDNPAVTNDLPSAILISNKSEIEEIKGLRKKLSRVKAIITPSAILKDEVVAASTIPRERIHIIPLASDTTAVSSDQRTEVREKFTGGTEYFLFTGTIARNNNWERVLQAFSQFKKWQQSSMKLVLSGNIAPDFKNDFDQQLEAYKYHHDIVIAGDKDRVQQDQLAAAAFLLITPFKEFENRQHIIDAFRNGVPVITEKNDLAIELTGSAAMHTSLNDAAPLSQQMITLYKDERLYNNLIQSAAGVAANFNWQEMLNKLSHALLSAAEG